MQKALDNFIKSNHLFKHADTILLAVSGGVDSVVLCHLFSKSKIKFAIAHCNFQLRGKESDGDEAFVEQLAEQYKVPFHSISFNTKKIASQNKESIQLTARNLRYEWFEKIRAEFKYDFIATAHHKNDSIETFFINLLRGSGIKGLKGIPSKNGKIIRPLLFASKAEIETYSRKNKLKFREDSSNNSDKYLRNRIRLKLIPLLKEINHNVENSISSDLKHLSDVEIIYNNVIEKERKKIIRKENNLFRISIKKLLLLKPLNTFLYELLMPFGFNNSQSAKIASILKEESGKQFFSKEYKLIKDRTDLIIEKINPSQFVNELVLTKQSENLVIDSGQLKCSVLSSLKSIPRENNIACIDYNKLKFPLIVRKWQTGDSFYPLGMKGKKKLSDFFIDNKLSIIDKEKTWVLTSNNQIVWVIGHRIGDRYKITDKTTKIYFVELV